MELVQWSNQNPLVNCGPLSDTMAFGSPWSFQTWPTFMPATSDALGVLLQGIMCLILVMQSITTRMVLKPSLGGRRVTKFIVNPCQGSCGSDRGLRFSKGE